MSFVYRYHINYELGEFVNILLYTAIQHYIALRHYYISIKSTIKTQKSTKHKHNISIVKVVMLKL